METEVTGGTEAVGRTFEMAKPTPKPVAPIKSRH